MRTLHAFFRTLTLGVLCASGALSLFTGEAQAQMVFAAEGRVGVTLPTGDLSDAGAESGMSVGAELQATFSPKLTAYLGLHRYAFNCEGGCGVGSNPRSTGFAAGLKVIFHNAGDALVWGRGGIVANTFRSGGGSGDQEIGFELGAGFDMPIAPRLFLTPSVGFISHDAQGNLAVSFFALGLGVHYHLN